LTMPTRNKTTPLIMIKISLIAKYYPVLIYWSLLMNPDQSTFLNIFPLAPQTGQVSGASFSTV
jgi:hypothetical protein